MAKNLTELLVDATKFPAAIEARLPEGAPAISATLVEVAGKIPVMPDFPMEIPDLPAPPEMPALPGGDAAAGLKRYVTGVDVKPVARAEVTPAPARRGIVPFAYE